MSLPVEPERLKERFPALTDDDLDAFRRVSERLLAEPRARGRLLSDVLSAAQRASDKEQAGVRPDEEEALALRYTRALAKMQGGPRLAG